MKDRHSRVFFTDGSAVEDLAVTIVASCSVDVDVKLSAVDVDLKGI